MLGSTARWRYGLGLPSRGVRSDRGSARASSARYVDLVIRIPGRSRSPGAGAIAAVSADITPVRTVAPVVVTAAVIWRGHDDRLLDDDGLLNDERGRRDDRGL